MQILSDIYLLALLLPSNLLLKCKNIELAFIIISFGLLLMTPKESLSVILTTASSNNLSMMQNVDELKLLHTYEISTSTNNINSNNNKSSASSEGLIKCNNKLKCLNWNITVSRTMKKDNNNHIDDDNDSGNYHIGKFNFRTRRDHETNNIDAPSTLHEQYQQYKIQGKLMKSIAQERISQQDFNINKNNNKNNNTSRQEDLIKWKNPLDDLQQQRNSSNGKNASDTTLENTNSNYNGEHTI